MNTVGIMTFNVQLGRRLDCIIAWLSRVSNPDILCFQEFPEEKIAYFMKSFRVTAYGYRFTQSLVWHKRIYGELTIFRTNTIRCTSSSILRLGVNRFERRILKNTFPRSCLITMFYYKNISFLVANVHLAAFAVNKYKFQQATSVVETLMKKRIPSVVLGDFNISSIFGKRKLLILMRAYGYETERKRLSTHRVAVVKHQFDYIFTKQCKISSLSVLRVRFSDHYPMLATVVI